MPNPLITATLAAVLISAPKSLRIGEPAPDFLGQTQFGALHLHEWAAGEWVVLMSHPKSFTPVCSTELATAAVFQAEFAKRRTKLLALSIDTLADQKKWIDEINSTLPLKIRFPVIADANHAIATLYGMIDPDSNDLQTVRSVFIIGPDQRIKLKMEYPATTGRSFPEILRVLDSLQLVQKEQLVTPADWEPGRPMLVPAGADLTAVKNKYGKRLQKKLDYLWTVEPER